MPSSTFSSTAAVDRDRLVEVGLLDERGLLDADARALRGRRQVVDRLGVGAGAPLLRRSASPLLREHAARQQPHEVTGIDPVRVRDLRVVRPDLRPLPRIVEVVPSRCPTACRRCARRGARASDRRAPRPAPRAAGAAAPARRRSSRSARSRAAPPTRSSTLPSGPTTTMFGLLRWRRLRRRRRLVRRAGVAARIERASAPRRTVRGRRSDSAGTCAAATRRYEQRARSSSFFTASPVASPRARRARSSDTGSRLAPARRAPCRPGRAPGSSSRP